MQTPASKLLCLVVSMLLALTSLAALAEGDAPPAGETASPDEANARIEALEAELAAAKDEITRLEAQRDMLLDEIRAFAIDLAVARGEDAEPSFDSADMRLSLVMPTYTRLIPYNGALHIVSADQKAQGLLSVIADSEGQSYTRGTYDHNQIFMALIDSWFGEGETPELTPTEAPEGLRLTRSDDGTQRDEVWLIAGETHLYCLEVLGEKAAIDKLFEDIAEGLTTY